LDRRDLNAPRLDGDPKAGDQGSDDRAARRPGLGAAICGDIDLIDLARRGRQQPRRRHAVHGPEKPLDLFSVHLLRHWHRILLTWRTPLYQNEGCGRAITSPPNVDSSSE